MNKSKSAADYVRLKIAELSADTSAARATLAMLRRGVGRAPGETPELWGVFLNGLPEEMMSVTGKPTQAEAAIYTSLTLYALHQQSRSDSANAAGKTLGASVRALVRTEDDMERVKRRFDAVATAGDMQEIAYYLRGLIQLMRACDIALDYGALCEDLYWVQFPDAAPSVKLRWGQDFYRMPAKDENAAESEAE